MFEQAFKNIDDVLWKEAGCTTELDYTEQTSWRLFLKYLDGLEQDLADEAALERKKYSDIRNVFAEGELRANSVVKESLTTAADGKNYATKFHNLDVIISVGYLGARHDRNWSRRGHRAATLRRILSLRTPDMPAQSPVVHSDPDILGGTPVFVGTRVPFQTLLDYLEAGDPLVEFLEDFPSVSREQVVDALEQAKDALLARANSA